MRRLLLFVLMVAAFTGHGSARAADCSQWTLDGYRLRMSGAEVLAVRSVTIHLEGQAEVDQPGKFHGAVVLDALNRLETWNVRYEHADPDGLRAEFKARFGEPVSDLSGDVFEDGPDTLHERRTIWRSTTCDAAIIVYDRSTRNETHHSVSVTLQRASQLRPGLTEMKTLFH